MHIVIGSTQLFVNLERLEHRFQVGAREHFRHLVALCFPFVVGDDAQIAAEPVVTLIGFCNYGRYNRLKAKKRNGISSSPLEF